MDRPDVMWHHRASTHDALRAHVDHPLPVTTGHHCPACGSGSHGRPWVRLADGSSPHVSLSRCGDHVLTAVAASPVGVDVESLEAVAARWDPALVLHPDERADAPAERAAMWCRKEAVLKALGAGMRTPMSEIRCADWQLVDLEAPAGLVAAVAVLGSQTGSGGSSTE
ncbi:4'-phosphopantetheinyl transferase family protein [Janibacter terrae]|uniref:4'-phosphopantetheinyl transferase family protein n=1 Tax=Janibacter terrae TaxID=103817 RepID=UPI0031F86749